MKKAFTMIELIFVIVVLGILASVALPKFAGVQDDAKIAAEKGTVGAVRAGVSVIKGKYLIMSNQSGFDGNVTDENNKKIACGTNGYPLNLDVGTAAAATTLGTASTLFSSVLSSSVDGWEAPVSNGSTGIRYNGPATKNAGGVTTGDLNSSGCWEYNGTTPGNDGQLRLISGC